MWETIREVLFPYKTLKIRLVIFLILVLIISLGFIFARREKTIAGQIVDCQTNSPIVDAEVAVNQIGWGFNDYLVWDKSYVYSAKSDNSGYFKIGYKVGNSANITAQKDGYIKAQQFEYPRNNVIIKMLQGNKPTEVTYNCKSSSECLETTLENGVQVTRNICFQ